MTAATRPSGAGSPRRLLSFRLGADEYAVALDRVCEILPFAGATWLPGFAVAVRGAVDLRGEALPAVELATALGLPVARVTSQSCLVVVRVGQADGGAAVGLIADAARQILELDDQLAAVPENLEGSLADQLCGVVEASGNVVRVIDLDRLLGANERVRGPADIAGGMALGRES